MATVTGYPGSFQKMEIRPITFREASNFIDKFHRHHKATVGHKFSIGLYESDRLIGCCLRQARE